MKTINDYKEKWDNLGIKCNLSKKEAFEAVRQDGDSLQYVKEQTEAICLEAVKQDGYSLRYVKEQIFNQESKMINIKGKNISENTILEALREYFNK